MNLKHLNYYIEIVKHQSFTKASKELFVCQSALSKAVKSLENEFGVELIDRRSKEFRLTTEGMIMFENGQDMLRIVNEQTERLYSSLKSQGGRLYVGIPPVISTAYFSSIIFGFREQYPDIELNIVEAGANTVRQLVDEGEVDIGVVLLPFPYDDNYYVMPAMSSENVLVVNKSHRLARCKEVAFSELKDEKFLVLNKTYMLYDIIMNCCQSAGFTPNITCESSQWDFLAEMVELDQGITILPKPILQRFSSEKICVVKLREPEFPWDIALIVCREKYISNPIKLFLDYVKDCSRKINSEKEYNG